MWTPGLPELIVILVICLLLFGRKLPEVARSLGKGITEFKKGVRGIDDDISKSSEKEEPKVTTDSKTPEDSTKNA